MLIYNCTKAHFKIIKIKSEKANNDNSLNNQKIFIQERYNARSPYKVRNENIITIQAYLNKKYFSEYIKLEILYYF